MQNRTRPTHRSGRGLAFAFTVALTITPSSATGQGQEIEARAERLNVLLITADDLNFDSVGVYGSKLEGITPNIDALAAQGMRFTHAHVNIAVCQPCRSVLLTGLYPHNNGARGFEPIRGDVVTLTECLRTQGYINGIIGKTRHLAPAKKFAWDFKVERKDLGEGREKERYFASVVEFLALAKRRKQPFFLMANSHDPHRPFAGSQQEKRQVKRRGAKFPGASKTYTAGKVPVPGFLPELQAVRREIAQYFTSVHRMDETVGRILKALQDSGQAERTIVIFMSDHGMALPFAKTNVYLHSTKVPWIVRWPGRVKKASVDSRHFVSAIDLMPTLLDALGVKGPARMDGRSFLPLLVGGKQDGRDHVLTMFHRTSARRDYPMRCLQDRRFGYIRNAWSDGELRFRNESQSGLTFRAMRRAAKDDADIAARVNLFEYRVPEELYDFVKDPDARHNLIADPQYEDVLKRMRERLKVELARARDPEIGRFAPPKARRRR